MKVQFLGAAKAVAGSCFVIEALGHRFCIDCGMHQGGKALEARNRDPERYRANNLDFVLLTHAHIDHSGLLPLLVKHGFHGTIYCTAATSELTSLMLEDSAHIQEVEAKFQAMKYARRGLKNPPQALYTMEEAQTAASRLRAVELGQAFEPAPGIKVTYFEAGHILGSGSLRLEVTENGKTTSCIFSGDIGRPHSLIVRDPVTPPQADYVFMESTYGDRNHKDASTSLDELASAIQYSYSHGGNVVIPAFAVERTQEILYCLRQLSAAGRLPADMPVFVDSPMAIRATEIFRKHTELFDADAKQVLAAGEDPFELPNLHYTLSREDSEAINEYKGSAIIISASGMCNAGRIKHHLRHNVWKPSTSVVFVGYQAVGTPGRVLVEGQKKLRLMGDDLDVKAKIWCINSFSAHAGRDQLVEWLKPVAESKPHVILVHGEPDAQETLSKLITETYGLEVSIPDYLEEMELVASKTPTVIATHEDKAHPSINWKFLSGELERKVALVREGLAKAGDLSWEEQTELEEAVAKTEYYLTRLLTRM